METPEEYLSYYDKIIISHHFINKAPKVFEFYLDLRKKFLEKYKVRDTNFFDKLQNLLDIDAQLQILLSLIESTNQNLCEELGMTEEEIIYMVSRDKNCFYRELTGLEKKHSIPWQLIYLSES